MVSVPLCGIFAPPVFLPKFLFFNTIGKRKYGIYSSYYGEEVIFHTKEFNKGNIFGALIFGFGWALTGACPGPLFAQIGTGATVIIVTFLSAVAGTWTYGLVRNKLPH